MASYWDDILNYAPDVINVVGAIASKKGATSKAKAASGNEEALRSQAIGLRNRQVGIAENADTRSQQLFDEWGQSFLPAQREGVNAQREALSLASRPIDPNVEAGLAAADYASADTAARGTLRRRQESVGVAPNSGTALEQERLAGLDSVAGRAAASTNARRSAVTTRLGRISATAAPLANAGNPLLAGSGSFATAANTGAGQAAAGLNDIAGDYGADASAASAVAGQAGASLGDSLSDAISKIFDDYKKRQTDAALQPVTPTVKPMPIMEGGGGGASGTFNAAGGEAAGGAKSFGYNEPTATRSAAGGFLGGMAPISTGLSDLDFSKAWGNMSDADLSSALGTTGAMKAIDAGAGPSTTGRVTGGVGGALDIYGGINEGGVKGVGKAVAGAAQLANALGAGGTTTGVAGTVGNLAAGNYAGAASSLAGTGVAGSASATIGAAGAAAGVAAAFIGVAKLAVHAFAGGASNKRNVAAFTDALGSQLETKGYLAGRTHVFTYKIPGKDFYVSKKDFDEIAGAWYGATYAPDGDQAGWQKKLEDAWNNLKPFNPSPGMKPA